MRGAYETGRIAPLAIIVMGVSGSGKSTLGAVLAVRLGCGFLEGDDFHSTANVDKMRQGVALTDEDRWPWLEALGAAIGRTVATDCVAVAACSSLKRSYRERLAAAAGTPIVFVLLDVTHDELERRLGNRIDHYMPASLLDSQLQTLERPGIDEPALVLGTNEAPPILGDRVLAWIVQRSTKGALT